MTATCSHCGAPNPVLRVFGWYTGLHLRCRQCRTVFRVVDSFGGLVLVHLAFAIGYLAGFAWLLDVEVPPWVVGLFVSEPLALGLWLGALPALLGLATFVLALGLLTPSARRIEQDPATHDDPKIPAPLTRGQFVVGSLFAGLGTIVLVLTVVFGLTLQHFGEAMVEHRPPAEPQPVELSAETLADWVFVDGEGTPRALEQLLGAPVVIHFFERDDFGTQAGLASLARLRRTVLDDGVQFVVCALVDEQRFAELVEDPPVRIPLVRPRTDAPGVLAPEALPSTLFLDPKGRLVWRETGVARWDTDAVVAFLRRLAAGD